MSAKRTYVSVLIASVNRMTGELLTHALNRRSGFRVAASATTSQKVLEAVQSMDVDVALISTTLADGPLSGFEALRQLRECAPKVKSIVLLENPGPDLVVDAFRAGAKGVFCPSQFSLKALYRCVNRVHDGQIWASNSELESVMDALSQLAPKRVVNADGMRLLTKREEDVVRLLAEGMQNREIARELNLSEHTIKNYLFHIFDKLGVSSRVELILYAVSNSKPMQIAGIQSDDLEYESVGDLVVAERIATGTGWN
jgi:DNA-binding NarL/FixJ family response regulator